MAEASLQEAEASLKQAEAALKKEMRNLEYTTIKSPVDGVVVKRLVNIFDATRRRSRHGAVGAKNKPRDLEPN